MAVPEIYSFELSAKLVEQDQVKFYLSRAETAKRVHPNLAVTTVRLKCGGVAVSSPKITDYRLSSAFVTGTGLDDEDLCAIEELYRSSGQPASIFIPSWAPKSTLNRLVARGFTAQRPINVYVLPLDEAKVFNRKVLIDGNLVISAAATPRDLEEFIQLHATVADADKQSRETQELLARTAAMDPRSTIYLARVDGRLVCANAAMYQETDSGEVIPYLQLGTTLPEYRRRGICTALNYAAQVSARERGCRYWYCMTHPDSASTTVMERLGCKVSFDLLVYVKGRSPVNDTQLSSIPWVVTLLRDEAYTTLSPRARYELNGVWDDLFFENTMKTAATIPERIYQIKGPQPANELRAFFRIGPDVTGAPATLMGGVIAAIMDQCFGLLMVYRGQHCEVKVIPDKNMLDAPVTTHMNLKYVRRVVVPTEVVVYVRVAEALEKTRWRIVGEMRDSEDRVCVKSECWYVRVQARI